MYTRELKENSYDFAILIDLWQLEDRVDYDEVDSEEKVLQNYMRDVLRNAFLPSEKADVWHSLSEIADDLRMFLSELSKWQNNHKSKLWKTMSEIKDDWTLVQISIPLIGYMWD